MIIAPRLFFALSGICSFQTMSYSFRQEETEDPAWYGALCFALLFRWMSEHLRQSKFARPASTPSELTADC